MNTMEIKLGTIASITSGLVVIRKQAFNNSDVFKKYKMLTLKSFEQNGCLNEKELEEFNSSEVLNKKYLTQVGDVIVRLSNPYTAVAITEGEEGILVPSLFAIIRLNRDNILSGYLSIFMNSEYMKKVYAKNSVGSKIQIIRTNILKDINVKIHSLEKQQLLVEFNKLAQRELKLLEQLNIEKEKLHKVSINKMF